MKDKQYCCEKCEEVIPTDQHPDSLLQATICKNVACKCHKALAMETPKEANYFDTSCQKCGHVPQGERHLCNWETPKENWREEFDKEFFDSNLGLVTLHDTDPSFVTDFMEKTLLTQRQERDKEILEMIEGMKQPLVTEDMPPMSYAYNRALSDLSERIEKRGDNKWL